MTYGVAIVLRHKNMAAGCSRFFLILMNPEAVVIAFLVSRYQVIIYQAEKKTQPVLDQPFSSVNTFYND